MINVNIGRWAAKNTILSVVIIVILEFTKLGIGVYLGKQALPRIPIGLIHIIVICLSCYIWVSRPLGVNISRINYTKRNLVVFVSSFILAILIGNRQSIIGLNNSSEYAQATEYSGIQSNKIDSLIKENEKQVKEAQSVATNDKTSQSKRKIGYFLLFLLSLVATYFLLALSCGLACSGYGLFAVLSFLLTIGVFSGGIYFLIGLIRSKPIKKFKQMSKEEKRKERRRYLKTFIGTCLGIVFLFIFQSVISGI